MNKKKEKLCQNKAKVKRSYIPRNRHLKTILYGTGDMEHCLSCDCPTIKDEEKRVGGGVHVGCKEEESEIMFI